MAPTRYSDNDLAMFRQLIINRLEEATMDYNMLRAALSGEGENGTDDTSPSFRLVEDLSDTFSKEEIARLAVRRQKHIGDLNNALVRIENKTYGICQNTGELIPRERLLSVPHTTLSIHAKLRGAGL
jgi:DnaK suppressor protein